MKQIVRLTESELKNIVEASVRRAIKEGAVDEVNFKNTAKEVGKTVAGAAGATALGVALASHPKTGEMIDNQFKNQDKNSRAFKVDRDELKKNDSIKKTADFNAERKKLKNKGKISDNRIERAVMESIKKLMNGRL